MTVVRQVVKAAQDHLDSKRASATGKHCTPVLSVHTWNVSDTETLTAAILCRFQSSNRSQQVKELLLTEYVQNDV